MLKHFLFVLAVLAQVGILAVKPAEKLKVRLEGRTITVRTAPFDPYDPVLGYFQRLGYEIWRPPGLDRLDAKRGHTVYTVLEQGEDGVWNAVSVSVGMPEVAAGQEMMRGWIEQPGWRDNVVNYGIEQYYVPEEMGRRIEDEIRQAGGKILVDVAVDGRGRSSIVRLRVGDHAYEY